MMNTYHNDILLWSEVMHLGIHDKGNVRETAHLVAFKKILKGKI